MDRRRFLTGMGQLTVCGWTAQILGCRGKQTAQVMNETDRGMVGTHTAGAETWGPLIETSVSKLLGRQMNDIKTVSHEGVLCKKRICFVGLENKSSEELGDFGEQIYEKIDTAINESEVFEMINRHYVEAGLRQCGLRPDALYVKSNMRSFTAAMEEQEQKFDYLLYAKITSGTTRANKDYQRDYTLTLELVNMTSGHGDKESADLRKGYYRSVKGKLMHHS